MQLDNLSRISEAPASGLILAYTRDRVIFGRYEQLETLKEGMAGRELLEIHLFDPKKEYRAIASESKRFGETGSIETLADFEEEEDTVYREEILLENPKDATGGEEFLQETGRKTIIVLNHIHYDDESGMAEIDNYRLI